MAKVLPSLDESEPVHGDLETVQILTDIHAVRSVYVLYVTFVCTITVMVGPDKPVIPEQWLFRACLAGFMQITR